MGLFDDLQERRPFGFSMASPSRLPSIRRPGASTKARPISMIEAPTQDARVSPPPTTSPSGGPKIPKRRSLLPQFPPRKTSADYSPTELSKVDESDKTSGTATSFNEDLREAVEAADRRAMPPPSKLGRPMSSYGGTGIRPPSRQPNHARDASVNKPPMGREEALKMLNGSSGGAARAHARAQSTQTSSLQRTGSTKLPQSPAVTPRGHIRAPSVKTLAGQTRESGIATGTIPRRPGTSGRPISTSVSSHGKKSSREASPPSPARPTSSARTQMPRPAFNTYQQHYSPAKTALPKPPIPSTRSSRSPSDVSNEGNSLVPADTCWKEQIELLQLSMLHQQSLLSTAEHEKDAEEKLGRKHAKLQRELESVKALEREQERMANLTAVGAWSPDAELLVENMLILGRVHSELSTLTQNEGRYDELVSVFEAWMEDAEAAFSGARAGFVENLPDVWRTTHTSLALKLRALQRDMEMLPRVPRGEAEKSSIGVLIRSCWEMLEGMLRELEVMSKLERVMLEKEKTRVDEDVMLTAEEAIGMKKDDWVPAWQSVAQ